MSTRHEATIERPTSDPTVPGGVPPAWRVPRPDGDRPDPRRVERIEELAVRLLESDEDLADPRWRRRQIAPGLGTGPALIFEDHSEIPMAPADSHTLEYRMAWFARDLDVVGLAAGRVRAFERHLSDDLALGRFGVVAPAPQPGAPLARRLAEDRLAMDALTERAAAGGLTIVPYIGTRSVWHLAEQLAQHTGADVRVAGPPPDLTERVNNKLWFAQRVRELLGPGALPKTLVASDPRELTAHLRSLARRGGRLIVKVPSSSGGRGIVAFEASTVAPSRVEATIRRLEEVLSRSGWDGRYPLLVGTWDDPVVASPSAQVWIPHPEQGPPIVEAICDQMLDEVRFVGASTTRLPVRVQGRLRRDALQLAALLQRLGYFGRCSFDSVLVGTRPSTAQIHWLECNGRWSSVGIASTAIRRVAGIRPDRPFVVVQTESPQGPKRSFEEVLAILGGDSFHRRSDGTGALVLSPRRVMNGTGLNLAVIARSAAEAQGVARRLLARFSAKE